MKSTLKLACVLLSFPLIISCVSKKEEIQLNNQSNQQNEETKKNGVFGKISD